MGDPTVVHVPDLRRWEVRVGDRLAGFTEYVIKGERYVFVHTEIDPETEGQGLGSVLARGALDEVRAMGASLVPLCPFIDGWIERHPEYDDLVDHELLDHFEEKRRTG
jgi:predicted GNAT family acetyltransferase